MKYISQRDKLFEAISVNAKFLKDFESQYTNDFLRIWDTGDFDMEESLERENVEDKVKELISDRNIDVDNGQWSNPFLDGFIDGVTTTQNGQLPSIVLIEVTKEFKEITERIFRYLLDTIEDKDEDYENVYDEKYVDLIVSNYLMDSNVGIMYTGEYKDLIVSILMNKKFYENELKKFILKNIKKGKYHVVILLKDIDKNLYKKYKHLINLDYFGFFED